MQQAARQFAAGPRDAGRGGPVETAQFDAREIVPVFNAYFRDFRVGYWLGKSISRALYRVRIGYADDAGLAAVPDNATVVFVMNDPQQDGLHHRAAAAEGGGFSTRLASGHASGDCSNWEFARWKRTSCDAIRAMNCTDACSVLHRDGDGMGDAGGLSGGGLTRHGCMREPKFGVLD